MEKAITKAIKYHPDWSVAQIANVCKLSWAKADKTRKKNSWQVRRGGRTDASG